MLEMLERRVANLQLMVAIQNTVAESPQDIPQVDQFRDEFEEWLTSKPKALTPVDAERAELMQALGIDDRR